MSEQLEERYLPPHMRDTRVAVARGLGSLSVVPAETPSFEPGSEEEAAMYASKDAPKLIGKTK